MQLQIILTMVSQIVLKWQSQKWLILTEVTNTWVHMDMIFYIAISSCSHLSFMGFLMVCFI
jgi:hypothetical protein